ncbi:MAG: reductive dehalogenase [Bacillota bacterium]
MEEKQQVPQEEPKQGVSRRQFLTTSGIAGAAAAALIGGAGVAEASVGPTRDRVQKSWAVKVSVRPRTVDPHPVVGEYKRFKQKNHMIGRLGWDESQKFITQKNAETIKALREKNTPGYGRYDQAFNSGAGTMTSAGGTNIHTPNAGLLAWKLPKPEEKDKLPKPVEIADLAEHTHRMRKLCLMLGASDVGFAKVDKRWLYDEWFVGGKVVPAVEMPEDVQNVIVIAIEMDHDSIATAPTNVCQAETGVAYSKLVAALASISSAVRALGFIAIPSCNEMGPTPPMAIDAGLGEQGRLGLIIHPKFGPRIRLGKIFTNMPLEHDKPIEFGVQAFCEACMKCAETCPAKCIPTGPKSADAPTLSENGGIVKWQVNHELCRANGWAATGTNCTICISVCPYNKKDGWIHDAVKLGLAKAPFIGRAVAEMDDLMGYGEQVNPEDWWKKI